MGGGHALGDQRCLHLAQAAGNRIKMGVFEQGLKMAARHALQEFELGQALFDLASEFAFEQAHQFGIELVVFEKGLFAEQGCKLCL